MDFQPAIASQVAAQETKRREKIAKLGLLPSGYDNVDSDLLAGGFSRGCVAGISAEDEDATSLPIAARTLVRALIRGDISSAAIITRYPTSSVLSRLRHAANLELPLPNNRTSNLRSEKDILRKVKLHTIFDIDGLWQALAEVEDLCSTPLPSRQPNDTPKTSELEIADSDDEDLPSTFTEPITCALKSVPGVIIITGLADVLTGLFTQRTRHVAHDLILNLNLQLHRISHSLLSFPLVFLLNSVSRDLTSTQLHHQSRGVSTMLPTRELQLGTEHANGKRVYPSKPRFGPLFMSLLDIHIVCEEGGVRHDTM